MAWIAASLALFALAVVAVCAETAEAARERKPKARRGAPADTARASATRPESIALEPETIAPSSFLLARAAAEYSVGNLRAVVEYLERIDYTHPTFDEADRAAFLLGQAYRGLDRRDRFAALARSVARWPRPSPYARWLAHQLLLDQSATRDSTLRASDLDSLLAPARASARDEGGTQAAVAADALAASMLLRDGDTARALRLLRESQLRTGPVPLTSYLKALALDATGGDGVAELLDLSRMPASTALDRELIAAATLRRAARMAGRGEDPRPLLESIPPGTRVSARARHMLGVATIERGDRVAGRRILESLLRDPTADVDRRAILLAIGGQSMDGNEWRAARGAYEAADRDWNRNRGAVLRLDNPAAIDSLWTSWRTGAGDGTLALDALPATLLAERLAHAATNLGVRTDDEPPLPEAATIARAPVVSPPPARERRDLDALEVRLADVGGALEATRWAIEREREALGASRRYFQIGRVRDREEAKKLVATKARIDALYDAADAIDAELRALRDAATRRVTTRSRYLLDRTANHEAWIGAMRHWWIDGPSRTRNTWAPQGYPSADSVLTAEEALARSVREALDRLAREGPWRIAASYNKKWRPKLTERIERLSAESDRMLAWTHAIGTTLDSSIAASSTSRRLERLSAQANDAEATIQKLRNAITVRRQELARSSIRRALAGLDGEREAIDYGLAASGYALAAHPERSAAGFNATFTAATMSTAEDSVSARWRGVALRELTQFLERYPKSFARGDVRFRLADLRTVDARARFREEMARYLAAPRGAHRTLPIARDDGAVALYRAILAEDKDFGHLDAVRFNAGLALADGNDPACEPYFQQVVDLHPKSPYAPEAWLRLGDLRFAARRFSESVVLYRRAAAGGDATLRAVAVYKSGWAEFEQAHPFQAAEAFREVLDLYASQPSGAIRTDLVREAETYSVQAIAQAGGAAAFQRLFPAGGNREYEPRLLLALGQHLRRYARYGDAAAVDDLFLARHRNRADALLVAQRLVDTRRRAGNEDQARAAEDSLAARFAPGGEWFTAQSSDSARTAATTFARTTWVSLAAHHHLEARRTGSERDWRIALRRYEDLLSRWPADSSAGEMQLRAGEASAQLGEYPRSLGHHRAAAASGDPAIAERAAWEVVAVTDAWYESSRPKNAATRTPAVGTAPANPRTMAGNDSLAREVIAAADKLLARYPAHPGAADLLWREAQLDVAHGWDERAAADYGRLMSARPSDPRAPDAAGLRADAWFRLERFDSAGVAYATARSLAQRAGRDSLAQRVSAAIPVCAYRGAEQILRADSTRTEKAATAFEAVASKYPSFEHAPRAQYRASRAWLAAGRRSEAMRSLRMLIQRFPASEFVRDAHLEIARLEETGGDREAASRTYATFADRFPADSSAGSALLRAADLATAAGRATRADTLRLAYLRRHPEDVPTCMEILRDMARREIAAVDAQRPVSALLKKPVPGARESFTSEYLRQANKHPQNASRDLIANVRFLEAEERLAPYHLVSLTLPLERSIAAKRKLLETAISAYRKAADVGVDSWSHASAYRIGEVLVGFGEALDGSQRPADLKGDDRLAYDEVLRDKSAEFYDRGETVWLEALRQRDRAAAADPWIERTQRALWKRLAVRLMFRPEVEVPLVAAEPPAEPEGDTP